MGRLPKPRETALTLSSALQLLALKVRVFGRRLRRFGHWRLTGRGLARLLVSGRRPGVSPRLHHRRLTGRGGRRLFHGRILASGNQSKRKQNGQGRSGLLHSTILHTPIPALRLPICVIAGVTLLQKKAKSLHLG